MTFSEPPAHLSRPTLTGVFGMAATTHWAATAVAQSVLERGGNAFDASVAAGFVMHVVEPHLNGPGGDMVALAAPHPGAPRVVVGQGPAPRAATIDRYLDEGFEFVPGSGGLSAAVPGAVDAWLWILREYGTWDVAEVLDYAIELAEAGQPLVPLAAATIAKMEQHFNTHWHTSADTWLVDGHAPAPGHVMALPQYARTLRQLVASAGGADRVARIEAVRNEWRNGFVARAASDFAAKPHRHSDDLDHAGLLDGDDFATFETTGEPPVSIDFRGYTVLKAPFWCQGPVLLQALAILDLFDDADLDPSTTRGVHTIVEAMKLAMADRDAYYGDTGPGRERLLELISPAYAATRAELITTRASLEFRPGSLAGVEPYLPPLRTSTGGATVAGIGEPTVARHGETRGDTVHLDVVDRWGNMVSATPSGGWLQGNPTIPELGFCLGTRLQMTWLDPASPSALAPGRRPRTTLTPTILERDGVPVTALGSPGGDQQDQWQLLYLLRTIVGGYSPQEAIDSPMFHTTAVAESFWPRFWTPGGLVAEDRLGDDVLDGLTARGHRLTVSGPWSLGRLSAVVRDPRTGRMMAAANPRGAQGYAAGR